VRVACLWLLAVAVVGCSGETRQAPRLLVDGSSARPPPVGLKGLEGTGVLTRARIVDGGAIDQGTAPAGCDPSGGAVVERVGVRGRSFTFRGTEPGELLACDAVRSSATGAPSWCGHAYARLRAGVLRDPRLSVTCRDVEDAPVGFAWVQPHPAAAYVVVASRGYHEVYGVAGDLPVRVTTGDVDLATASAAFSVSEHARGGRRLRTYELEARVSG
jgi:hypothetical protein